MSDLTEFLLARITEDEAVAQRDAASPPPVSAMSATFVKNPMSPDRVLAECEAKRRIVELRYSWNLQAERATEPPFGPILKAQVITADTVLRTLAMPYADHPDYREEWRV